MNKGRAIGPQRHGAKKQLCITPWSCDPASQQGRERGKALSAELVFKKGRRTLKGQLTFSHDYRNDNGTKISMSVQVHVY